MLYQLKYSLQGNKKTIEGNQHPDRNAQFEYINTRVTEAMAARQPVISADTKKKELVGNYKNNGRQWLADYETIVNLISATKTSTGLTISYYLNHRKYKTGIKVSKKELSRLNLKRDEFHGEWNYTLAPRKNPLL